MAPPLLELGFHVTVDEVSYCGMRAASIHQAQMAIRAAAISNPILEPRKLSESRARTERAKAIPWLTGAPAGPAWVTGGASRGFGMLHAVGSNVLDLLGSDRGARANFQHAPPISGTWEPRRLAYWITSSECSAGCQAPGQHVLIVSTD